MTHTGTMLYTAPEIFRGERYDFAADVFSFAITMYELCDRVSCDLSMVDWLLLLPLTCCCYCSFMRTRLQTLPYSKRERLKQMRLAKDIADGKRPCIHENWNPAVSCIIVACWADDPALRLPLGRAAVLIAKVAQVGNKARQVASGESTTSAGLIQLAPGERWRRVQTNIVNVTLGKILGSGSFSTVYACKFQGKDAAFKLFRNATEEKAFKEIEMMFSLRHPNIIGMYAW